MGRVCAQRLARNAYHVWLGRLHAYSCDAGDSIPALVWHRRNTCPLAVRFDDLAGPRGLSAPRAVRFPISDMLDPRAFSAALRRAVLLVEKAVKIFAVKKARRIALRREGGGAPSPNGRATTRLPPHPRR